MSPSLTYSLVTPTRDEPETLKRLAGSIFEQTRPPLEWIIVDNGSTDATRAVAGELAATHSWVRLISVPGTADAEPGAPVVRAFHAGLRELRTESSVVVKLDADVSMKPDYFDQLLVAFETDDRLGIASGVCMERNSGGWHATYVTGGHVRGATRAYRWECLQAVLPLEERMGWDGIDELKANVLGWRTGVIPGIGFYHHRRVGARDGGRTKRWQALGRSSHYMGYRPSYLVMRALFQARRDPAALAMIWSYVKAAVLREPRYADPQVRAHLKSEQRLRRLPRRASEAQGRGLLG